MFDEKRYFTAASETCVVPFPWPSTGLLICEDFGQPGPALAAKAAGPMC